MHFGEDKRGFEIVFHSERLQPLIAAAIHDGHSVRSDLAGQLALSDSQRLREEDPFTARWTNVSQTRIIGLRSRFEVDLNRPRENAVYRNPEDAWGLAVWKDALAPEQLAESLASYDAFYSSVDTLLREALRVFPALVVFDLHSYNHRREGPDQPAAAAELNPEINVGTGTMDRSRWASIVDRVIHDLGNFDFAGRKLDVRENVRFQGGQFPRWIHQNFPHNVCALAIEAKKFFMDEWTGAPDWTQIELVQQALESTVPGILEDLKQYG
jgi:N-formylglutamate amidohydrolase